MDKKWVYEWRYLEKKDLLKYQFSADPPLTSAEASNMASCLVCDGMYIPSSWYISAVTCDRRVDVCRIRFQSVAQLDCTN